MTLIEPVILTAVLSAAASAATACLVPTLGWWTVPVVTLCAPIVMIVMVGVVSHLHRLDPPEYRSERIAAPKAGRHGR